MLNSQYDAILILGRSLNIDGSIVDSDKIRLEKIADLLKASTPSIIVCGSHGYKSTEKPNKSQARAYADYLESLGINRDSLFLEEESQETLGNILFAKINFLIPHNWHQLLVIPTYSHSTERVDYLLTKILGNEYNWDIERIGENDDIANTEREARSLKLTKEINNKFNDGDHEAIFKGLLETHPAYGGTKWTIDELREQMKH